MAAKKTGSGGRAKSSATGTRSASKRSGTARGSSNKKSELTDLEECFLEELADMLHAEKQLVKELPRMAEASRAPELRQAIEMHLEQTRNQVGRIEEVFRTLEEEPHAEPCEGMMGILKEGKELLEKTERGPARDALIIGAAQKVEHYEIASYGTLCAWAEQLGYDDACDLLEQTLDEEKSADKKLTRIAEGRLNRESSAMGGRMAQGYSNRRGQQEQRGEYGGQRMDRGSSAGMRRPGEWQGDGDDRYDERGGMSQRWQQRGRYESQQMNPEEGGYGRYRD
jgi:ferritin-like metal-binding protein YciE